MTDAPTIETSTEITEIAKALPVAQAAFEPVALDADNPHFGSRYASLHAILAAALPALNANGISFLQLPSAGPGVVQVTTWLLHTSGQWLRSTHPIPASRNDAQGIGSALTYAKRQAAAAILGIAAVGEDDDGEGAVGRGRAAKPPLGGDTPKEPQKAALGPRVARLEGTMQNVKTLADLTKAWELAKPLREELLAANPSEAARMDELHETRHHQLIGGAG